MANTSKKIDVTQEDQTQKELYNFAEFAEKGRKTTRLMTLKNKYNFIWAQKNGSVAEGRVGKLVSKAEHGTLKADAFMRAIEILKDPNKREDSTYRKLIDHLIKGEYSGFGENFPKIAEAFESKDNEVKEEAKFFVEQQEIQGERSFLKKIARLKKAKLNPDTLINQTKGALAVAGIDEEDSKGPHAEEAVEVIEQGDLGVLPTLPEGAERYRLLTQKIATYEKESTEKLNAITEVIRQSGEFTDSKTSLKVRLDSDPDFAQKFIENLIRDVELLKKASTLLDEVEGSPELLSAVKEMELERNEYFTTHRQSPTSREDSPQAIFLRASESKGARETLTRVAQKNIDKLSSTIIELEMEREIDTAVCNAEKVNTTPTPEEFKKAITKVRLKYGLDQKSETDAKFLEDLGQKAQDYISHSVQNAELRSEFTSESARFNKWKNECLEVVGSVEGLEAKTGIRLLDKKNGLRIYPRKPFKLIYEKEGVLKTEKEEGGELFELEIIQDGKKKRIKRYKKEAVLNGIKLSDQYDEIDLQEGKEPVKQIRVDLGMGDKEHSLGIKTFTTIVDSWNLHEDISSVADAEKEIEMLTGIKMQLKPGLQLLDQLEPQNGEPRCRIIGIRDIIGGRVVLEHPIVYVSKNEKHISNPSQFGDDVKDELTLGELCRLIRRRNLTPLGASEGLDLMQDLPKDPENPKPFGFYDRAGGKETKWLAQNGTLESLFNQYGSSIFAGTKVTDNQLDAFKNTRTFDESGYGEDGVHFKKTHIPGARLMSDRNKKDIEEEPTADNKEDDLDDLHEKHSVGGHEEGETGGPHGHDAFPIKPPASGNPKERNEIIPFDVTGSIVDTHIAERGYVGKIWQQSRFLSVYDLIGFGKAVYENYQRRWHRQSKERFSSVGKGLPFGYGAEMSRIKQQAEDEEVHTNVEAMEHWGIDQIIEALHSAQNADQLKACFEVLAKKGHLRWDDCHMWEALNKYTPDYLTIPIPANHNPYAKDKLTGKTGFDYIEAAIDSIWGESTYQEWKEQNNSTFNNKVQENFEHGKQLEGDPKGTGGVDGELQRLLTNHKNGEYVDPHEYEGLLRYILEYGKGAGPEAKLYYIIEGLVAENKNTGETILSLERLSSINGKYCNVFPMLDYLTSKTVPDPTAEGGKRQWTLADFKAWAKYWDDGDGEKNKPNQRVIDHLWNYALTDRKTIVRTNKGIRKGQEMDHDDSHIIMPLIDSITVGRACQVLSGQSVFSQEGYANVFAGYNQYLKVLGKRRDTEKLVKAMQGWVRFDSIMSNRYKKDNEGFIRLGDSLWKNESVVDDWTPLKHKKQIYSVIDAVAEAYSDVNPHFAEIVRTMQIETGSLQDKDQKNQQDKVQQALDEFDKELEKTIESDGGAKLAGIINQANLRGMGGNLTSEQRKARKLQMEAAGFSGKEVEE